jgi:hypothetical protein
VSVEEIPGEGTKRGDARRAEEGEKAPSTSAGAEETT